MSKKNAQKAGSPATVFDGRQTLYGFLETARRLTQETYESMAAVGSHIGELNKAAEGLAKEESKNSLNGATIPFFTIDFESTLEQKALIKHFWRWVYRKLRMEWWLPKNDAAELISYINGDYRHSFPGQSDPECRKAFGLTLSSADLLRFYDYYVVNASDLFAERMAEVYTSFPGRYDHTAGKWVPESAVIRQRETLTSVVEYRSTYQPVTPYFGPTVYRHRDPLFRVFEVIAYSTPWLGYSLTDPKAKKFDAVSDTITTQTKESGTNKVKFTFGTGICYKNGHLTLRFNDDFLKALNVAFCGVEQFNLDLKTLIAD